MMALLAQLVTVASSCATVDHAGGTVYVFRHCVRSIDMSILEPFVERSFPSWCERGCLVAVIARRSATTLLLTHEERCNCRGVGKDMCLPRGLI